MKLLITGGAGFIGSNFVKFVSKEHPDVKITVLDALTYCGNMDNFTPEILRNKNFSFCHGNILDEKLAFNLIKKQDKVVHFAAWTHIDRSITLSDPFMDTDFKGTQVLLEAIKKHPVEKFIHISTSEVYGSAQKVPMDESHPIAPQSPYAGAKAGSDRLAYSYWATYKLPITIIRPFNVYGPNQYPEKLIPFFITNALENKNLLIYGDGKNTRDWTYVTDTVRGIWNALEKKNIDGEVINVGSQMEVNVIDIAKIILNTLKKPDKLLEFIGDRPGHVTRLFANRKKAKSLLNWEPKIPFDKGLEQTINWYVKNKNWWQKIRTKPEYKEFETLWYGQLRKNKQNSKIKGAK
ncbi:MAG: dTDP-glucose 4,6-dehydratase [bacterium]|nr:dTDP-glucose 4,6-dehydratase [bacterium]